MERNRNHLELAVFGQFIAHFASGLRSQGQVVRGVTEQEVLGSFQVILNVISLLRYGEGES